MVKAYLRVFLLIFMVNGFARGDSLNDMFLQEGVAGTREVINENDFNKDDGLYFLKHTLFDIYVWNKTKDNQKFLSFSCKCDYFRKNMPDERLCDKEDTPFFIFNLASWYEEDNKDILPMIKMLIKKLCEDSLDRDETLKVLAVASAIGDKETMSFILNGRNWWDGHYDLGEALYNAVLLGELDAVKLLLQHGARRGDICVQELLIAMHLGYEEITQLLLKYGADIEEANAWLSSFPPGLGLDSSTLFADSDSKKSF